MWVIPRISEQVKEFISKQLNYPLDCVSAYPPHHSPPPFPCICQACGGKIKSLAKLVLMAWCHNKHTQAAGSPSSAWQMQTVFFFSRAEHLRILWNTVMFWPNSFKLPRKKWARKKSCLGLFKKFFKVEMQKIYWCPNPDDNMLNVLMS